LRDAQLGAEFVNVSHQIRVCLGFLVKDEGYKMFMRNIQNSNMSITRQLSCCVLMFGTNYTSSLPIKYQGLP
jgi:hypothetical protein